MKIFYNILIIEKTISLSRFNLLQAKKLLQLSTDSKNARIPIKKVFIYEIRLHKNNRQAWKIPMWVADMNFETVPTITQAIIERAAHPAFGYFSPTKEYYSSIINWHKTRNLVKDLTQKHIG